MIPTLIFLQAMVANDAGREKIEEIYANVFNTEDALVRPTLVNGTHALSNLPTISAYAWRYNAFHIRETVRYFRWGNRNNKSSSISKSYNIKIWATDLLPSGDFDKNSIVNQF